MRKCLGACAGLLTIAGWAASAAAQPAPSPGCDAPPPPCLPGPGMGQPGYPPIQSGPGMGQPGYPPIQSGPGMGQPGPGEGNGAPTGGENPGAAGGAEGFGGGEGRSQAGLAGGTMTAGGTGLASATATGGVGGATTSGFSVGSSGLILPGLFTAAQSESALPVDRLFVDYGYFDGFRSVVGTPTLVGGRATLQSSVVKGFDLNRFDFGVEKTFFEGAASIVVRTPILEAADNITGQSIDGFGDIDAGVKVALFRDCETGNALSVGCDVSVPTGRPETFTINQTLQANGVFAPTSSTTINPTFVQPYVSGVVHLDNLFVQDFLGCLISTDGRISPFINEDLAVGYTIYRCPSALASFFTPTSLTPTVEAQLLIPTSNEGSGTAAAPFVPGGTGLTTANSFSFPDQLFLTEGFQLGLGQRSVLSAGIVEPLIAPKAFTVGVTAGFTILY